jgi:hypothetical protein
MRPTLCLIHVLASWSAPGMRAQLSYELSTRVIVRSVCEMHLLMRVEVTSFCSRFAFVQTSHLSSTAILDCLQTFDTFDHVEAGTCASWDLTSASTLAVLDRMVSPQACWHACVHFGTACAATVTSPQGRWTGCTLLPSTPAHVAPSTGGQQRARSGRFRAKCALRRM